jgi:hypothetical protein
MSSSRRGGTNKLLNRVGTSGKETCAHYTCLRYEAKGDVRYRGASPFSFTCTKMIFNSIFSTWTSYPTNGCHAMSTREAHALHGVGGSCGAQAVRDLQMGHMSRVEKPVSMCSSKCGGTKLLYCALMRQDERRHTLYGVCLTFESM